MAPPARLCGDPRVPSSRPLLALASAAGILVGGAAALPPHVALWARASAGETGARSPVAVAASGRKRLDLLAALADRPPGAFFRLMGPLVVAANLSYSTSRGFPAYDAGSVNSTIPPEASQGAEWERVYDLEASPEAGGVHATVFVDRAAKRAIVAFRGSCVTQGVRQCQLDLCFLQRIKAFGAFSHILFHTDADCGSFAADEMNYVEQAEAIVRRVQARFPEFGLLLTGHSMGGALAIVSAARQPGVLQAVTFAPSAFDGILFGDFNMTQDEIAQLPADDLVATGDPYDCMINVLFRHNAREGATTCLFEDLQEPWECDPLMKSDYVAAMWRLPMTVACKVDTHDWTRYVANILARGGDGVAPAHIPVCTKEASVLRAALEQSLVRMRPGGAPPSRGSRVEAMHFARPVPSAIAT